LSKVVIIGGGFGGLSAGVRLAEAGIEVELLERRGHLGGRAYSFVDPATGDVVDNGQHLFMGCYYETISFLRKIGCLDRLKFQSSPRVDFLDKDNGYCSFRCPDLPAPLHALAGLMRLQGLTISDKLKSLNVGRAIRRNGNSGAEGLTVSDWLDRLGQSDRIKQRFWYPMIIATLNQDPNTASARMMKSVLHHAFGSGVEGSRIGISRVGLSELYTDEARRFIEQHGGSVRLSAEVKHLTNEGTRLCGVTLRDGQVVGGDFFISAVPPAALAGILPMTLRAGKLKNISLLDSSPIVSINLWLDRPVLEREFVGLLGTRTQWAFNKDMILRSANKSNQVALVISAARGFVGWSKELLVEMAMSELNELLPESRAARVVRSVVVKEREATLSHTVESDLLRPGLHTSLSNFFLAGDWVDTGLPATIESAVKSGHAAAQAVLDAIH